MANRGRKPKPEGTTLAAKAEIKGLPRNGPEQLVTYASGDGALHFVWQQKEHGTGQTIATGRSVTMDDARKHLGTNPLVKHLIDQGWKLWGGDSYPMLVADVQRTGLNTIKMDDREYTYHIDQTDPFYIRDGEVRQVSLSLTYTAVLDENETAEERTVRNVGTLSVVAFFLNHEKALAATPPEALTYEFAD